MAEWSGWKELKSFIGWTFSSPANLAWALWSLCRLHPLKRRFALTCKPNKRVVELDITAACPVGCYNCDRAVPIAPSNERMSVAQVDAFVSESLSLRWRWKRIVLIGGEPLVHPELPDVLQAVKRYKDRYPRCVIEICTSGYGKAVRKRIEALPSWLTVTNTNKTGPQQRFDTYNVAPRDLPDYQGVDYAKGCVVTEFGISLNHRGYYPCGAGGAVDRVFGMKVAHPTLAEALASDMRAPLRQLCQYCGHFKRDTRKVENQQVSQSWWDAIERFHAVRGMPRPVRSLLDSAARAPQDST